MSNKPDGSPIVGILMGSDSDLEAMSSCPEVLAELGIPHEIRILSAHRTPEKTAEYARTARERGLEVLICGAGGAAHLAGVVAADTILPVIGVPMKTSTLGGQDSLLSMVQMPRGIPVATVAIGPAGAKNAGLLAAQILALSRPELAEKLCRYREKMAAEVLAKDARLQKLGVSDYQAKKNSG
jgi:5-(carboxyamino)imidazole ribonucleotide mutase